MKRARSSARLRYLVWIWLLASWSVAGCGGGSTGPGPIELRTEVVFEAEDSGLIAAVQVDTVYWEPGLFNFTVPDSGAFDGRFGIVFRNLGDRGLDIRFELLFFDVDTFLIDRYVPLGQPVRLEPEQTRDVRGDFVIRAPDVRDLELLATMQVKAGIEAAP